MAARKKKTSVSDANADDGLPFETLMERLEVLVDQLEIGEMSLEESLGAYEQGVALVRNAQGRLDDMDTRLEELLQDGTSTPLQIDDDAEEA